MIPPTIRIQTRVECPVFDSFRVQQIAGMFDLHPSEKASAEFDVDMPSLDEPWSIGLIVGPSGSGKTTVARRAFGDAMHHEAAWPPDRAVIDGFGARPIKQIVLALSSVGLSSPPAWIKPYAALSNGEKFRCDLARALLSDSPLVVVDEFTSVVDRTVAKIGSAAVAKAIRSGRLDAPHDTSKDTCPNLSRRFVAVSCHYDIAEWLEPDWILDMAGGTLTRGRLRRPAIHLEIHRVPTSAWRIFQKHHYLSGAIHPSATCFLASIDGAPAAFEAWLPFVGKLRDSRKARRGHRLVCLPDFQGVGIGSALSNSNASLWAGLGYRVFHGTSHPAEMRSRLGKPRLWRMTREPGFTKPDRSAAFAHLSRHRASSRLTASFEYVGPPMPRSEAERCLKG